ncbi:hypothetical protein F5Y10DRAFT_271688 [Nemania abortiva]|nr:hypothetical protein F5Y10DRAFT_271688 [Nemania abortiva]
MRISPLTNSTTCIITAPEGVNRDWLLRKLREEPDKIRTCPIYLFNTLCEKLDSNNEAIASEVFNTFEAQERKMDRFCGKARQPPAAEREAGCPNENAIYREHGTEIINLNFLNNNLMTLACTTEFELSALGFARTVMSRYRTLYMAPNPPNNLPRILDEELQVFENEIGALEAATRLRQSMRASAQQRAEHIFTSLETCFFIFSEISALKICYRSLL